MGRIKDILNKELFGTKKKKKKKRRRVGFHFELDFLTVLMVFFGPFGFLFFFTEYRKLIDERILSIYRTIRIIVQNNSPLAAGLSSVSADAPSSYVRAILRFLGEDMEEGASLADSLTLYPRLFSKIDVELVRAAEESGQLIQALDNLIENAENRGAKYTSNVAYLVYVVTNLFAQMAIVSFLLIRVVPVFAEVFADFGAGLPWYSLTLIDAANFLADRGEPIFFFLSFSMALFIVGRFFIKRSQFLHGLWFRFLLCVPIARQLTIMKRRLMIAEGLEIHLNARLPLVEAIDRVSSMDIGASFKKSLRTIHRKLSSGSSTIEAIPGRSALLGSMFGTMLALGESAGTLPESCARLRNLYKNELKRKTAFYADAFVPAYSFLIGGINLWILLALYGAVWGLSDVIIETM